MGDVRHDFLPVGDERLNIHQTTGNHGYRVLPVGDERLDIHQTTGNHGYGSGVAVGISAHRLRVVNLLFCSKSLILKVTERLALVAL